MPRLNKEICFNCVNERRHRRSRYFNFDRFDFFSDFELNDVSSPIFFNGKKHAFKECSELKLDQELDFANKTTEWHICKYSISRGELICERIYNKDEEYCSKHNKKCLQCESRERVNNEIYCSSHANQCQKCRIRSFSSGYCSECQEKYLRCQAMKKGYCSFFEREKCLQKVAKEGEYYLSHKFACQEMDCLERMSDSGYEGYCYDHRSRCLLSGCPGRIGSLEKFCLRHLKQWKCSRCEKKVEGKIEGKGEVTGFCLKGNASRGIFFHEWECCGIIEGGSLQKCCLKCSNTVSSSNQYCWVHLYPCLRCENGRTSNYNSYCSKYCEEEKLKQLIQQSKRIVGKINKVERFTTWWSKDNVATIITQINNHYWVFLGVIDRKPNSTDKVQDSEIFIYPSSNNYQTKWGIYSRKEHNYLWDAQSEAEWLRTKLDSDNPILVIHPEANKYTAFSNIVYEPYVRIDYNASQSDFKPLDIAWVERRWGIINYYHVGIYLGKGEICHLGGDNNGTKITDWSDFLKERTRTGLYWGYCYHPIIPFKSYKDIIRQAFWAEDNHFGQGQYCLANRNCEHFANSLGLGINFSKQVYDRPESSVSACLKSDCSLWNGRCKKLNGDYTPQGNNNKGSAICLRNEIKDDYFGKTDDAESKYYEKEHEARIEQPVNIKDCVIM